MFLDSSRPLTVINGAFGCLFFIVWKASPRIRSMSPIALVILFSSTSTLSSYLVPSLLFSAANSLTKSSGSASTSYELFILSLICLLMVSVSLATIFFKRVLSLVWRSRSSVSDSLRRIGTAPVDLPTGYSTITACFTFCCFWPSLTRVGGSVLRWPGAETFLLV